MLKITINEKTIKGMLLVTKKDKLIDNYFSDCDTLPEEFGLDFLGTALKGSIWDASDNSYTCKLTCDGDVKAGLRLIKFGELDYKDILEVIHITREAIQRKVNS